ncbi:MAG: BREX-1 system adenine-specific DNA-methyltransferase PglX [Aliarcobacter skirrowii]|uniref:BREX-1 system adenine-specific DNA-methyltransferase PglX n=1 Tax=Aliarcobacter skirrowii TaxID=28200 RepID=UPI00242D7FF5|nr:BREX-1 system adenine-specific DNA-methyltransferase PglX [Aliarcobacter skirrowii]MDD2508460.1 BREX-1 system adenine-specific DNA-methyltransferase PglX [Aliarcobacter skirrowii]MDD3497736.1 BREX-1 system adenine-specific DNA-methyltransferase PglX [Aliarcobacter skirrowii]
MNKSGLKKFATNIRIELLSLVKTKVDYFLKLDISNLPIEFKSYESSIKEIKNRCTSDEKLDKSKYEDFIEEVSYIWFNRLVALRFMDVNDITDTKVISPLDGHTIPAIFTEAKSGNISDDLNIDKTQFFNILDKKVESKDSDNECYKMLFISTCNYYSSIMPFMFESIADYTELLLPDDLLSANSIRNKVIDGMSEEDCSDIEVIGWLYQFYISEKKDDVFEKLKKNVKITPSNIPAATQLFTPHWIVKYMVENSLGKLWMLNHPNSSLKNSMKYYIDEDTPTTTFLKISKPQELTLIDPCCGSGHVLTYAFDLLTLIYEEEGFSKSEIPTLILENNLFGCDIDKRASTLANFALTMKARLYHRRFFKNPTKANIIELQEFGTQEFKGIKNFGSLLAPKDIQSFDDGIFSQSNAQYDLQLKILTSTYSCVVTNPPYMGGKGMNAELGDFVKKNYPDGKFDMFAVFIERGLELTKVDGFMAQITMQSWMFLSSFEKLRVKIIENYKIDSLVDMGWHAFGNPSYPSTAFTLLKNNKKSENGTYIRLTDYKDSDSKEQGFFKSENRYEAKQDDFEKIPGSPIAYWVYKKMYEAFIGNEVISKLSPPKTGMTTGDDNRFLRQWYEVSINNTFFLAKSLIEANDSGKKWFPYNKGGVADRWFGHQNILINWESDGGEIKEWVVNNPNDPKTTSWSRRIFNSEFFFKEGATWTLLNSGNGLNMRYLPHGFIMNVNGPSLFPNTKKNLLNILGFLNSNISIEMMKAISPTLANNPGDISKLPIIFPKQESTKQQIDTLTQECIDISKEEWDSRETSWDFTKNELLKHKSDSKIETAYNNYCSYWREKFYKLHANEEELNRLFIDIYELNDELTPDVDLKDITILKSESIINDNNELEFKADEIMKQFISYAVGVMFGRYSLDSDGLVVANLNQDYPKDTTFEIDDDNVIPVLEDDYFSDDIASRIINFVKTTFGAQNLSENINFIEKCLGKTIRAYMVKDFYEDHIKRYKKRPIYWMVSSTKKGFMSLSYMHRYTNDLFARVQNNYLREYITKLEGTKDILKQIIVDESASSKDKKDADKKIKDIENKLKELISFDRDVLTSYAQNRVDIDLDDGVKVNYNKFKEVLYPIKGLDKE